MSTLPNTDVWTVAGRSEARMTFPLDDPATMWIVRAGDVDVFAVRLDEGEPVGAIRPLFRARAGDAVFGIAGDGAMRLGLLARRSHGSDVISYPRQMLRGGDVSLDGVAVLDHWIDTLLGAAVNGATMPKNMGTLHVGSPFVAEDTPRALSTDRVVWVRHSTGTSLFLGMPDIVLSTEQAPCPLSPSGWIQAQPESTLRAIDSFTVLQSADAWDGLDRFHAHIMACIAARLRAEDDVERQRLIDRGRADLQSLHAALWDLASPLNRHDEQAALAEAAAMQLPLLGACRVIGRVLRVTFTAPPDMIRGVAVKDPVARIAQASGIRYRRIALKDQWWKVGGSPLLAFRDSDNHPVALIPSGLRRRYHLYDPSSATRVPLDEVTAASLNPFGYMFYPPFPSGLSSAAGLLRFGLKGTHVDILAILATSLASGALTLAVPIATGIIFDSLIPDARRSDLVIVAALLVVTALAVTSFNLTRGFAVLRVQGKLSVVLQAGIWDRLLSLPAPFFRGFAAGDLADRSMAISHIRSLLTASTLGAVLSGLFSMFSLALMVYYSPLLALIALALTLFAALATGAAGAFQLRLERVISTEAGRVTGIVLELIAAIAKFRVAGAEGRGFALWVARFASQKRADFRAQRGLTLLTVFNAIYLPLSLGVLFAANSALGDEGRTVLSTGYFLAFTAAVTQFMAAILGLSTAIIGVMTAVPLYERAAPILTATPEVSRAQGDPGELTGHIDADHLVFRYRSDAPLVLRDVSFSIRAGEYVAFVGPSGCGKSTLFRHLLGFERAESGALYYDNKDLAGLDVRAVRRQIGVVLQGGTLLSGSIFSNIAAGAGWLPLDEVWEAARLAGLDEDLKGMPMGLHTSVSEGGGGLSGGQRQRVLIARAVVRKPRILLFDEATSALDNRTQARVSASLKALKATRIVIAHRLSTIVDADRIYVMDEGQIRQVGTYNELLSADGLFRRLAARQLA